MGGVACAVRLPAPFHPMTHTGAAMREQFEAYGFSAAADGAEKRRAAIEAAKASRIEALEASASPEKNGEGPGTPLQTISPDSLSWEEVLKGAELPTDESLAVWQQRFNALKQIKNMPRGECQKVDAQNGWDEAAGWTGVHDQFYGKGALVVTQFSDGLHILQGQDIAYAAKRLNLPGVPAYVK